MTQQLEQAKKEEERTHSFAQSLGLLPSKTHEKYSSCADTNPPLAVGYCQAPPATSQAAPEDPGIEWLPPGARPQTLAPKKTSSPRQEPAEANASALSGGPGTLWGGMRLKDGGGQPPPGGAPPEEDYHDFSLTFSSFLEENFEAMDRDKPREKGLAGGGPLPKAKPALKTPWRGPAGSPRLWKSPRSNRGSTPASLKGDWYLKKQQHLIHSKNIKIAPSLHSKKRKQQN